MIVRKWLDEKFPNRSIDKCESFDWSVRSPDLKPCYFFLCEYLKNIVFKKPATTIVEFQNKIEQACTYVTEF